MSTSTKSIAFKPFFFEAIYQWIIQNGKTPHLLINTDSWGVQVPKHHVKDGRIVLNAEPRAVRDFTIDKERSKLTFLAKFDGSAQLVSIPMRAILAIYAIQDGLGWRFSDDSDQEDESSNHHNLDDVFEPKLVVKLSDEQPKQSRTEKRQAKKITSIKTCSEPKVDKPHADSDDPELDPDPNGGGKKTKAPWLKLVK